MRAILASVVAALGLIASDPSSAGACSCVQVSPERARDEHAAVFEGRVIAIEAPPAGDSSGRVRVTFEVVQQWKGVDSERAIVTTASSSAACGVAFEAQTSWLVYADREGDVLTTGLCSRTRRIEDAEEDVAALGAGVVPVDITEADEVEEPAARQPPAAGGCASCSVGARRALPLGVAPWLVISVALARRRRASRRSEL